MSGKLCFRPLDVDVQTIRGGISSDIISRVMEVFPSAKTDYHDTPILEACYRATHEEIYEELRQLVLKYNKIEIFAKY